MRRSAPEKKMVPRRVRIDRLVAWSPVLLLGGLAALTYWLDAQVATSAARNNGASRHDPDLYIENFSAVSFDAGGRVLQSLTAKRAQHYPDDDSVDLVLPSLTLTDPGKPRLAVNADEGTISGNREIVTLRGNVRAVRDSAAPKAPTDGSPIGPATFTTDMLRVIPKRSRAETERPVTIEEPRGMIRGVGMILDNEAHTIKLKSAVSGTLQPARLPK
jgi:lipopolysaccharide export system protein LptC